jgi:hypothetical protein
VVLEQFKGKHLSSNEVEFITIMTFESLQNVIDFQGENYVCCYVPEAAQKVLKCWDQFSSHYEAVETRNYGADSS